MLSHRIGCWTGSKAPWALQEQTGSEFSIGELDTPYLQMYNLGVGSFPANRAWLWDQSKNALRRR